MVIHDLFACPIYTVKQYDDIDPPKESKDEEDMRRHGFIMPRSPEKPMTKKGKAALKEWQEPYQESEDEIDGIGFVIGES